MKRLIFVVAALVLVFSLAVPAVSQAQTKKDTVVLAFSRQPDSLFFDYNITSTAGFAMRVIYNSLVKAGPEGKFVGDLAESWKVSDDQLTWTFNLRKGVKWHDGQPFTANDVAFSFTYPADKDFTGTTYSVVQALKGAEDYHAGKAKSIEGVKVIDDNTISLTTSKPYALFLDVQGQRYIAPEHILKGVAVKDLANSSLAHQPIGTGPYRLVKWKADESLTYEAFPDYYGDKPKIKNYIWKIIPEKSSHPTELQGGTVDIVPEVLADDFPALKSNADLKTLQLPGVNFTYIVMNQKKPFFADVRVRQAMNYAVDKDAIIKAIGGGNGMAVTNIVHPSLPEYNPNLKGFPYNPDKAKSLLADAGWKDKNADGVLISKGVPGLTDGTPFSVEFGTMNFSPYNDSAQIVQQDLKAIGIQTDLKQVEFNIYFSDYLTDTSDYTMATSGWFAFEQVPQGELEGNFLPNQPTEWTHWKGNPELQDLLTKAPAEFDAQKRIQMYWRAEEIIEQNALWVMLTRLDNLIAYNKNLNVPKVGSLSALFSSVPQWTWGG